jgi:hypothetical protein
MTIHRRLQGHHRIIILCAKGTSLMWIWNGTSTSKWIHRQGSHHPHHLHPGSCETTALARIDEIWKRWACKLETVRPHHHQHPGSCKTAPLAPIGEIWKRWAYKPEAVHPHRLTVAISGPTPRTLDPMPVHRHHFSRHRLHQMKATLTDGGGHPAPWR